MRVSVRLAGEGPPDVRSIELGPMLTLIRRIRGAGLELKTAHERLAATSLPGLEQLLDSISRAADISALRTERRSLEIRTAAAASRLLSLDETQFQLVWNVAQVWIAAVVLFPVPLLVWSWDEIFSLYIPHGLVALAMTGSIFFLRSWFQNRPEQQAAKLLHFELEMSLRGIEEQLGKFPPLLLMEESIKALAAESLEQLVTLLQRFAPARDIIVLASEETGRQLSLRLVAGGGAETTEGENLAVTRI